MAIVDQRQRLERRHDKIRAMVAENDVRRVAQELLDFVRNFGGGKREIENEAIVLSGRLKRVRKKERNRTEGADKLDVERNQIFQSMLDLAGQVYDEARDGDLFAGYVVPDHLPESLEAAPTPESAGETWPAAVDEAKSDPELERARAEAEGARAKALEEQREAERKIEEYREAAERAKAECQAEEQRAHEAREAAVAKTIAAREEQKAAREAIEQARAEARAAEQAALAKVKEWEGREAKARSEVKAAAKGARGGGKKSEGTRKLSETLMAGPSTDPALRCKDIQHVYRGSSHFFKLKGIDLELYPGEIIGLVGENGSGKTTLIRILAGELAPVSGTREYPILERRGASFLQIRNRVAHIQQHLPRWYGKLKDNLHLAASLHGITGADNEFEVEFFLHRLGLDDYRDASWNQISGGYKMRFELAKALVWSPDILLLDEPLAPLDINTQQMFLQDLRDLADSLRWPLPILLSSQHLYEVESIADRMVFLGDGEAHFYGRLDDLYATRDENTFEIACEDSSEKVSAALRELDVIEVQDAGLNYLVFTSRKATGEQVLNALIAGGVKLKYFRDISRSTRKMFRVFTESE